MPQSLSKVIVHVIFSTKHRRPLIATNSRQGLNAYLAGILDELDCLPVKIGCAADHVHILLHLCKNLPLAKVIEEVKKGSSKWMKTQSPSLESFYWQSGYGAFSVSESNIAAVREYIATQDQHHRTMTFQEEFRRFLDRHHVDYDERYVWG